MTAAAVIPVKAFAAAKLRLAPALAPDARRRLARSMAEHVIAAAAPMPVTIVCDDDEVASWATALGVLVEWTPGLGLDGAVEAGVAAADRAGAERVLVAHADLPLAADLPAFVGADGVVIVPDRHGDGTNVIVVPAGSGFRFAYGPRSAARHRAEAVRLGLAVHEIRDPRLGWDVDLPGDLDLPSADELRRAARCS